MGTLKNWLEYIKMEKSGKLQAYQSFRKQFPDTSRQHQKKLDSNQYIVYKQNVEEINKKFHKLVMKLKENKGVTLLKGCKSEQVLSNTITKKEQPPSRYD